MPPRDVTPRIDLRVFPGVVTMTRLVRATDRLLVTSAQRNAARAMSENHYRREDFASQADAIHSPAEQIASS